MPINLITTRTKTRNGVYCVIIHKTKYIDDILCTVITLPKNEINLYTKKCFFQTYTTAIFNFCFFLFVFFEKLRNIYKNTFLYFYDETRSSHRQCSIKKLFLKILQHSLENTCFVVFFYKVAGLQA